MSPEHRSARRGSGAPAGPSAWRERRLAAALVRFAAVTLPAVASGLTVTLGGRLVPAPTTVAWAVARVGALVAGATLVMLATRLGTRRLLPLGALLSLSLAFPDETPKRLRLALRAPSARRLQAEVDAAARWADPAAGGPREGRAEAVARIVGLVAAISSHHRLTRGHSERVRAYADLIAQELGLDRHQRDLVRWAALLHDLGKLTVPTTILDKPGRPDADEWRVLAAHPAASARLAEPLREWMGEWWYGIGQHHECWDGTGYPDRLAGEAISRAGRIVALADAFETMTATRSYKRPMSVADARREVVRCAGTHFDPAVVRAFLNVGLGRLHRVAGWASWLPVPVLAGLLPARVYPALTGFTQTVATAASGTVGVVGTLVLAPTAVLTPVLRAADAAPPAAAAAPTPAPAAGEPGTPPPTRTGRAVGAPAATAADPVTDAEGAPASPAALAPTTTGLAEVGRADGPTTTTADPTATTASGATTSTTRPAGPGTSTTPTTERTTPGGGTVAPPTAPPPTAPPTTAPAGAPSSTTVAPTTAAAALLVTRNDDITLAAGGSLTVAPLANDTGHDASTFRIVRADKDLTVVHLGGGNLLVTLAALAGDNGNSVTYEVCAPSGACAQARIRVKRAD